MVDHRVQKLAQLCVRYCVNVKPNEQVIIQGTAAAYPLINEIYKECLLSDAHPIVLANLDTQYIFFKHAKDHQLKFVSPIMKFVVENIDVSIGIFCEPSPKGLSTIDPVKMRESAASRRELTDIFYRREADGNLRWTGVPYPISAQAQEASMALEEYEDFVYGSCLLEAEDPIGEWKKVNEQQKKTCEFLDKAKEVHMVGEDTDITFGVQGRKWINCAGKGNMPDGEVFTAPIENSVNGTIRFTYPGIYAGREVEDIRLMFKDGRVVNASAAKGDDFLQQILKVEGADRIGETSIGTNYGIDRFTKNMLFDEKMGGTIHMALGNSLPESLGQNKSAVHWDMLKDMRKGGEIYADGKLFYKGGKFLE